MSPVEVEIDCLPLSSYTGESILFYLFYLLSFFPFIVGY